MVTETLRKLIELARHPAGAELWLKSFPKIVLEARPAAVEEFRPFRDDAAAVGLLLGILRNHRELAEPVLSVLAGSSSERAFTGLAGVLFALPESHGLRPPVQAALDRLDGRWRAGGIKPCPPDSKPHGCFAGAPDGIGSSCVVISKLRPDGQVGFVNMVWNDGLGVKDAFGGVVSPRKFEAMLAKMRKADCMLLAEVSLTKARERCVRAEKATFASGRAFPEEYLAWTWDAAFVQESVQAEVAERESAFEALAARVPQEALPPFHDLFDLFDRPCIRDWGFETAVPKHEAERLAGLLEETQDPGRLGLGPIIDKGVPESELGLWSRRLLDYAFVLWMRAEEKPARLALWASESLKPANRLSHPFLQALALRSLGMLPAARAGRAGSGSSGIGRNAPCPCGSGRKYKKCCLGKDALERPASPRGPGWKPPTGVSDELTGYALQALPRQEVDLAWSEFSGTEEPIASANPFGSELSSFMDWLFLGRETGGKTLAERFEEDRAFLLGPQDIAQLGEIKSRVFGIFEVAEVRPGEGVVLEDIFDGRRLDVHDISASRNAVQWDLLATWVLPTRTPAELWGVGYPLPPSAKDDLKKALKEAFSRYKTSQPRAQWQRFLNSILPLVRRLAEKLHEAQTRFLTPEGDPVEFCEAVYRVADFPACLRALRESDKLDELSSRVGADDRLAEADFEWAVLKEKAWEKTSGRGMVISTQRVGPDGEPEPYLPIARFALSRENLKIECLSKKRLSSARGLAEALLGKAASFQKETVRSPEEAMASLKEDEPPEKPRPDARLAGLTAAAAKRHAEGWLKHPIPALGGLKPAEAAATAEGRVKLLGLLKEFENRWQRGQEGRGRPDHMAAACMLAMRELLGLPVPDSLKEAVRTLDESAAAAQAAAEDEPEDPVWLEFKKAMQLHQEGRLAEALVAYEKLKEPFRTHPVKFQFWGNLGACLLQSGNLPEAVRCLETAIEIEPDYAFAEANLKTARKELSAPEGRRRSILTRWFGLK